MNMSNLLTLQQIAERKSKRLNLDLVYCQQLVSTMPEFFKLVKDGEAMICSDCQRDFSVDGIYSYHGKQICDNCHKEGLCHKIKPDYELVN